MSPLARNPGRPAFRSLRSARAFCRGYLVPRVVVRSGAGFLVVHPRTAARRGLPVLS